MRREYIIGPIHVNSQLIDKIIIDDHVDKHFDHISDELIINIVLTLNNKKYSPIKLTQDFQYFSSELEFDLKKYKAIWLLEKKFHYIGIITIFRDRRIK